MKQKPIESQPLEEIRKEAYHKVLVIMNLIHTEIDLTRFHSLDSIQYRIKSESSIIHKQKKVGTNIYDVYDLIGIRYIFHDLQEAIQLKEAILNHPDFVIKEIKNYIPNGHPEDPNYKALHIRMSYQGFPCEIELMDIKMSEHVIRTHTEYKNGQLKLEATK